jgi:hypothetical protein
MQIIGCISDRASASRLQALVPLVLAIRRPASTFRKPFNGKALRKACASPDISEKFYAH